MTVTLQRVSGNVDIVQQPRCLNRTPSATQIHEEETRVSISWGQLRSKLSVMNINPRKTLLDNAVKGLRETMEGAWGSFLGARGARPIKHQQAVVIMLSRTLPELAQ
jgi:hypothetical protein